MVMVEEKSNLKRTFLLTVTVYLLIALISEKDKLHSSHLE